MRSRSNTVQSLVAFHYSFDCLMFSFFILGHEAAMIHVVPLFLRSDYSSCPSYMQVSSLVFISHTMPKRVNITGSLNGGPEQFLGYTIREEGFCKEDDGFCAYGDTDFDRYYC